MSTISNVKTTIAAVVAAAGLSTAAFAETAPEAPKTEETGAGLEVSGVARLHAATLANGAIKFNELPEFGVNVKVRNAFTFVGSANIITKPGENLLTNAPGARVQMGDGYISVKLGGGLKVNAGQFEYQLDPRFKGETWTQSGVGFAAPLMLDEPSFSWHDIANTKGFQVLKDIKLSDSANLYLTGSAGVENLNDKIQGMAMATYAATTSGGGSYSLTAQFMSRDVGGAVSEKGLFFIAQGKKPINDKLSVRGDVEVGAISNVAGAAGKDGTVAAARLFLDQKLTKNLSTYFGAGAFREASGDTYQAIEGGVAYQLWDNVSVHGGLGYANDGFAEGVATTVGLTLQY